MSTTAGQSSYAEDRAQIEDLMARYLFAMDWNDFDTYAECFTEDGVLDYAMGLAEGRETIRAEAKRFKDNVATLFVRPDGQPAKLRHVVAHKAIRVEGDRAWNTGFWFEMADDGPECAPKLGSFGHYEDELARVGGEWKFKRRKIYNEFLKGRGSSAVNPVRDMDDRVKATVRS
jgi:ketosteroid isomerase-like protein